MSTLTENSLSFFIKKAIADTGYSVNEVVEQHAKEQRLVAVPDFLTKNTILSDYLNKKYNNQLRLHQAEALTKYSNGDNVCIATGTASGKSLVFQMAAIHKYISLGKKTLVLYTQTALASDQAERWKTLFAELDMPIQAFTIIEASMTDMKERLRRITQAKVVVMTPDMLHLWLMSNLDKPEIQSFLSDVGLLVLDEAHEYEGVFGSHVAYLIRRLQNVKKLLSKKSTLDLPLQYIVASATIAHPIAFLKNLTAEEFKIIDSSLDGAPQAHKCLIHVDVPMDKLRTFLKNIILVLPSDKTTIIFIDSRKEVERVGAEVNFELNKELEDLQSDLPSKLIAEIAVYRAGYEQEERKSIEDKLKMGKLKAVITTSALEIGIDIPHLQLGINMGMPATKKSFFQRIGRVGRSGESVFILACPSSEFNARGGDLNEFLQGDIEPSHLYLHNHRLQFVHALCLANEISALGLDETDSQYVSKDLFSPDFNERYFDATGVTPPEYENLKSDAGEKPHRNYSIRNMGQSYSLHVHNDPSNRALGSFSYEQAMKEAYVGAIYRTHGKYAYRIKKWDKDERKIWANRESISPFQNTDPDIVTNVLAKINSTNRKAEHTENMKCFIAEASVQVKEMVVGYKESTGGKKTDSYPYANNRHRQVHNFLTHGVLFSLDVHWQKDKLQFVNMLETIKLYFCFQKNIKPADLKVAVDRVSVTDVQGNRFTGNVGIVYDKTGILRLSKQLFSDLSDILDNFTDDYPDHETSENIKNLHDLFKQMKSVEQIEQEKTDKCWETVFAKNTNVLYQCKEPQQEHFAKILDYGYNKSGEWGYTIEYIQQGQLIRSGAKQVYPHQLTESIDNETCYECWNKDTDEIKPLY